MYPLPVIMVLNHTKPCFLREQVFQEQKVNRIVLGLLFIKILYLLLVRIPLYFNGMIMCTHSKVTKAPKQI